MPLAPKSAAHFEAEGGAARTALFRDGWGVATKSERFNNDRIKEVIRLLRLAIEDCQRFVEDAEEAVKESRQDKDPPG